jgi:cobalt-zinc-cadmium efflux system protein
MSRSMRLWIVFGLNIGLVGVLAVVGVRSHSLGVLAEGVDYLADAAAISVALLAIWLSHRPPTAKRPRGYPKATTWAALLNGGWLLVITVLITAEAIGRLISGTERVHGLPVLVVSGLAAAIMVVGAVILGGDEDDDNDHGGNLNMHAVLLETVADAAIAGAVAVVGAVILASGGYDWLDPTVALLVSMVIGYHAVMLLRRVAAALRPEVAGV